MKKAFFIPYACSLMLMMGLFAGQVQAFSITEIESNDTIATAQNIDASFSVGSNPDIEDSTTLPWVSISATGDGTFDYYSFTVDFAGVGIFDIDFGYDGVTAASMDTHLFLYNTAGTLLADNDDGIPFTLGAGGSISPGFDSYLSYSFSSPDLFVIGVGVVPSGGSPGGIVGTPPAFGDTYTLQVSVPIPEPTTIALLGIGLFGLAGRVVRQRFKRVRK